MSGYQSLADAGRESPQPVAAPLPAPIGDGDPLDAPWRKHLATRGLTRVPDGSTPACMICGKHFNFLLRRRHHCRRCGACVCDGCSNHRLPLRFCQGHDGPDSVQRAAASLDREAVEGYVRACSRCAAVVDARIRGRVARRTSAPPPATTDVGVVDSGLVDNRTVECYECLGAVVGRAYHSLRLPGREGRLEPVHFRRVADADDLFHYDLCVKTLTLEARTRRTPPLAPQPSI